MRPLCFDINEANRAGDDWGFSCGPAVLCALFGLTPEQVRHHLAGFTGYMNPTMMWRALDSLGRAGICKGWSLCIQRPLLWPSYGLARVQWGGPWCNKNRPPVAAYKHTHWVAARTTGGLQVFDINAIEDGGWIALPVWSGVLVPHLLRNHRKADGRWWLTHVAEVRA